MAKSPHAERIIQDPDVLVGKPVIKGTRLSVEAVLAHLAANPDLEDLFAAYPRLTAEDLRACFSYAEEVVRKVPKKRPTNTKAL